MVENVQTNAQTSNLFIAKGEIERLAFVMVVAIIKVVDLLNISTIQIML